jgi:hypothetical protein
MVLPADALPLGDHAAAGDELFGLDVGGQVLGQRQVLGCRVHPDAPSTLGCWCIGMHPTTLYNVIAPGFSNGATSRWCSQVFQ